ncbi:MAG: hypothetical protein FWE37_07300 [Spirochaetaceae bacterium]|nr:hypothetical protein [Spirochaetaceae bacterium]
MRKVALLAVVAMLAVNAYAVEIGIGGKLGAGIGWGHITEGVNSSSIDAAIQTRQLGLPIGGEVFVNLGVSELIGLQLGVAFSYALGIGDISDRGRVDGVNNGDWSSWETWPSAITDDLRLSIISVGLDILVRFNLPLNLPIGLYVSVGPNIGYSNARTTATSDIAGYADDGDYIGSHFLDITGVLEFGAAIPLGPGALNINLRSRIGGGFSLASYDQDGSIELESDEFVRRFIGEVAALRIGYSINF